MGPHKIMKPILQVDPYAIEWDSWVRSVWEFFFLMKLDKFEIFQALIFLLRGHLDQWHYRQDSLAPIGWEAVGWDSGVPFTLSNFLKVILQPYAYVSKCHTRQIEVFYFNLKLLHRKKVVENFRKFISQERLIRISIWSAHCLYLTYFSDKN